MKVLVVEDNPRLSEKMKKQLQKWFIVETANTGDKAVAMVIESSFDIVLLDLGLPDMSGLEVCRHIRKLLPDIPILIVTGVDETVSKVKLLDTGADDYITKPFELPELKARIYALSRRRDRKSLEHVLRAGDLELYPASRTVFRNGTPITLRKKEFDILEYLLQNKGYILDRVMIVNHAWTTVSSSWTGSVDVHIKQLRDKVDKPFDYPLIKTCYGVGYTISEPDAPTQPKVKPDETT